MADPEPDDAAGFARRHAGERDTTLTAAQRELLGRVIARRIERGAKLDQIARAAATALFDVPSDRARRLGRDEALRAFAWESLHQLRAGGATHVVLSPAQDACPACVAVGGTYATDRVPAIPVVGCAHPGGCRCRDLPAAAGEPGAPPTAEVDAPAAPPVPAESAEPAQPTRPWYRTRPPRPHGPRWSDEEREAHRPPPHQPRPTSPPRPNTPASPPRPPRHNPPALPARPPRPKPPALPPRRQPAPRPPRPASPAHPPRQPGPPRPHRPSRDRR